MDVNFPIISFIIFVPLLGALEVYLVGKDENAARLTALLVSLVPLALSFLLVLGFLTPQEVVLGVDEEYTGGKYRAFEEYVWIPQMNVFYRVAVDELSLALVFLTTLLVPLAVLFSWDEGHRVREFFALLLIMETTIIGVFTALDFFVFFVFWELQLVPMYFLIAIWGGPRKRYAALKFFLYTQAASLLVLLGIFAFYHYMGGSSSADSFNMVRIIEETPVPLGAIQDLLFVALLIGFGTKLPMVPFHTWLPDAHVEAPTAGSVLLAGVLLKMGGYGIIRVNVQMLPESSLSLYWLLAALGTISILYGAIVCLGQDDLKRLIANSSISHMGFVLLGIAAGLFAFSRSDGTETMARGLLGFSGAIFQMFAHGLISAALFMVAGSVGHRTGTRNISELGGITAKMPKLAGFMMASFLASLGLPGLVGFVAEFTVFVGTYEAFGLWVLVPMITVVLTAAYYLYATQRAAHGPYREGLGEVHDIEAYEVVPLAVLTILFALFGLFPSLFMDMMNRWVVELLRTMEAL